VNVWVTAEQANTDSVARLLDGATGVWFGGGDQVRLARVLRAHAPSRPSVRDTRPAR
jgi:cyanophycinase-like exopeptidase